jgi:SAM-dependent methyltransferase
LDKDILGKLDHEFYRFNHVEYEGQKKIYETYLPMFDGCTNMVDLACGPGHFPRYMKESGKSCVGVDSDPAMCEQARSEGVDVECRDVLDYLRAQPDGRFDGVFSGHLVEHLPFDVVLELAMESCRVLRPGGVIVLTTPNVRALYAHFEGFYMHFGHVRFYHPRLLEFFLQQAGFSAISSGENEVLKGFVLRDEAFLIDGVNEPSMPDEPLVERDIPAKPLIQAVKEAHNITDLSGLPFFSRLKWTLRLKLAGLLSPFHDVVMNNLKEQDIRLQRAEGSLVRQHHIIRHNADAINTVKGAVSGVIRRLDGSVEAYVRGVKP